MWDIIGTCFDIGQSGGGGPHDASDPYSVLCSLTGGCWPGLLAHPDKRSNLGREGAAPAPCM